MRSLEISLQTCQCAVFRARERERQKEGGRESQKERKRERESNGKAFSISYGLVLFHFSHVLQATSTFLGLFLFSFGTLVASWFCLLQLDRFSSKSVGIFIKSMIYNISCGFRVKRTVIGNTKVKLFGDHRNLSSDS